MNDGKRFKHEYKYQDYVTGLEYDIVINAIHVREINYGSDADGNRGIEQDFVDPEEMEIYLNGVDVTEESDLNQRVYKDYQINQTDLIYETLRQVLEVGELSETDDSHEGF